MVGQLDLKVEIPTSVLNVMDLLDLAEENDTVENLLNFYDAVVNLAVDDLPAYNKALSKRNKEKEQDV